MITCLSKNFAKTEACDELIDEWENDCSKQKIKSVQIFSKKYDFFLNK